MVFIRKFAILALVSGLVPSYVNAGVFEALSQGAYFLSSGGGCSGYDQKAVTSSLEKAECLQSSNTNGIRDQAAGLSTLKEQLNQQLIKTPEDKYFTLLAKQHSRELTCAGDFAKTVANGDHEIIENLNAKVQLLRDAKQRLVAMADNIAKNPRISSKVCPTSTEDLEPSEDSYVACKELIQMRTSYYAILASIPLSNVPKVRSFLENYANLKAGPELKNIEASLDENIKKAYSEGRSQLVSESEKLNSTLETEGPGGFDRGAKHALLSDPLIVNKIIKDGGNDKDLKGLACYADSRYGKGADDLNTGLMVGSFVISAGVGTLARIGSAGLKIAEGATAIRSAGLISLNGMRALQVSAAAVQGVSAYSTIDSTCFANKTPKLLASGEQDGSCVSAPSAQQLSQDSCVLAVSLSALGFTNIGSSGLKGLLQKLQAPSKSLKAAAEETVVAKGAESSPFKPSPPSRFVADTRGPGVQPKDTVAARNSIREIDEKLLKGGLDAPENVRTNLTVTARRSFDSDENLISARPASQEIGEASAKGLKVDGLEAFDHEYGHAIFQKNMSRYSDVWKKNNQEVETESALKGKLDYRVASDELDARTDLENYLRRKKSRLPISNQARKKWVTENAKKTDEFLDAQKDIDKRLLTSEERKRWSTENNISIEYQEVFADLISAAKRNDGAALGRTFEAQGAKAYGRDFSKRFSSPPANAENEHNTLDAARNFIWNKYFTNAKNSTRYPQMLEKVHKAMAEEIIERGGNKQLYELPKQEKVRRLIEKLKINMREFE